MGSFKKKVYVYYLKKDCKKSDIIHYPMNNIYAFTIDKSIRDEFELERNMELFHKKIMKLDEVTYEAFSYKNKNSMLFCNVLSDGIDSLSYTTTYYENDLLDEKCHRLEDKIIKIQNRLKTFPLKGKVEKELDEILTYWGDGIRDNIYHFDTFHLFIHLFHNVILCER